QVRDLQGALDKDGATMQEIERRNKERDLANLSRDLQRAQREFREDVNLRRNEELAGFQERANKVILQIAEAEKFDLILQAAVVVAPEDASATALPKLIDANPYATFARVATILHPIERPAPGIHATAQIDASAHIARSAAVGAGAVIGARATIGERVVVGANGVVGADASIADDAIVHAGAILYPRTVIGARSTVHSGAVIGADGFGMAEDAGRWVRVPQIGRVVIGADAEVGASTTIDRGA